MNLERCPKEAALQFIKFCIVDFSNTGACSEKWSSHSYAG